MIDPTLTEYATETQSKYLEALNRHGSFSKAANALGCNQRSVERAIENLKKAAAKQGYSPEHDMTRPVPDPYRVKGVSTLYNEEGQVSAQWVKSQIDPERLEQIRQEALDAFNSQIKREKSVKPPKSTIEALLNCYVVTDYHLGMLSWHEETGDDWDVSIAEDLLVNWFAAAVNTAPNTKTAVLAQLGDFLHHDGLESVTPEHKNVLDADTRFQKMARIAIRALRRVIRMLLEKHDNVHVIMAEGNHDPASSIWLRESFHALYENEPRVTVDLNPDPYYCYEHGETSLFFHHGHRRKPTNIDDVFVSKYRDVFGRTKFSYAHMGHLHNQQVAETNLMLVEQHRTLAAHDAYASRGGWISGRDAKCISYHRDYGEVGRITISPDMVRDVGTANDH